MRPGDIQVVGGTTDNTQVYAVFPGGTSLMCLGGTPDTAPVIVDVTTGEVTVRDEAALTEGARNFWQAVRLMASLRSTP